MLVAYQTIHWVYAIFMVLLVLFETNLGHLCILLFVIIVQTVAIVVFRGCPTTLFERRHTKKNHKLALQQLGIGFECNHEYESQVETMIHLWSAVTLKIFVLMLVRLFSKGIVLHSIYYPSTSLRD